MNDKKHANCYRGANLVGLQVATPDHEPIGNVEDLVVDLDDGRVTRVVIAMQRRQGEGERLVALPWRAVACDGQAGGHRVVLQLSKEELPDWPNFSRRNWPDMDDPIWTESDATHGHEAIIEPTQRQKPGGGRLHKEAPLG